MIPDGEQSAWKYGNIILYVGKKVQVIKLTISNTISEIS